MKIDKLDLNVTGDVKGPIELIIREGQATEITQPKKVRTAGTIYAPLLFVLQNYNLHGGSVIDDTMEDVAIAAVEGELPKSKSGQLPGIVAYDYGFASGKPKIEFDEIPAIDDMGAVVTGTLVFNKDLAEFRINDTEASFTSKALIKHLTKYAGMFADFGVARTLIGNLRNLEVKFTDAVKKANDMRGNVEDSIKQEVAFAQGELPANIVIQAPIFYGTPKVSLTLEIQLERKGHEAVYSFYCMELESVKQNTAISIINSQVTDLKNLFVCIEQI